MKAVFWKKGFIFLVVCFMMLLFPLTLIIAGIITTIRDGQFNIMIVVGIGCLAMCIRLLLYKDTFTKIILSDTGIELKYGKKQLAFIEWLNITDVDTKFSSKLTYLVFMEGDTKIECVAGMELFNTIMDICPNRYIKNRIEDLPALEFYKNRRLKKLNKNK